MLLERLEQLRWLGHSIRTLVYASLICNVRQARRACSTCVSHMTTRHDCGGCAACYRPVLLWFYIVLIAARADGGILDEGAVALARTLQVQSALLRLNLGGRCRVAVASAALHEMSYNVRLCMHCMM